MPVTRRVETILRCLCAARRPLPAPPQPPACPRLVRRPPVPACAPPVLCPPPPPPAASAVRRLRSTPTAARNPLSACPILPSANHTCPPFSKGYRTRCTHPLATKTSLVLETSDPESGQGGQGPRQVYKSTNIGQVSYAVIRTYKHSGGRSFRRIHQSAAILSISMFAHLPSGVILIRVPDGVKVTERSAEVSKKTIALFTELLREKAWVMHMVTVLTMIQRNSGGNVNVLDIEEDDGVDD
ncbi:hypothetical protein GGX14DRAFT_391194 [Mycena pura]|uniref:Uncharacterized protein n=1 Tax=Mycena pura TaxID=153505 RepID=A0AAD6YGR9_9AGAR|nr:hypothetical protein GGX14DRAFT_391194 [Mycena pura]